MWMSQSNTKPRRNCKGHLTKSRNPRIVFGWSSIQYRRWSGAPDRKGSPTFLMNRPSTIPACHWTKLKLAGLALFILTTRRACCRSGVQYGNPVRGASLKLGSGASMANIVGFCFEPSPCAMSRATLSNGTGRPPISRTGSEQKENCGEAKPN